MIDTLSKRNGDGDDALARAIAAVKQQPVPPGPDRALITATLDALRTPVPAIDTRRHIFTRTNAMRIFTTAAALLVLVSLVFLTAQVTRTPPSAFGNALMQLRGEGAISYVQTIAVEGKPHLVKTKTFVSEDGRMRTEQGPTVTISEPSGRIRITLMDETKTAHVSDPRPMPDVLAGRKPLLQWLEMLRELDDKPDKELGSKEIDGKLAKGFVATRANQTFTLWVDEAGGDPVLVEYDSQINGKPAHISMSDFRFGEKFPESFFSYEVPVGYKIYGQPADGKPIAKQGLEVAWSHQGFWTAVDTAIGRPGVYALKSPNQGIGLDQDGKTTSTTLLNENRGMSLRTARLKNDSEVSLLRFGYPGENAVRAYQQDGTLIWNFKEEQAVNDVCPFDLDGDGLDEVIISYNASGGIRVLNPTGELRWKDTMLTNVWHVTAGKFTGDGRAQAVVTSGDGKAHLFDADGKPIPELEPGFYAHLVRSWRRTSESKDTILVAGGDKSQSALAAITLPGKVEWSTKLPARAQQAAAAQTRPWLAISLGDGSVRVVDLTTGNQFAQGGGHGGNADVAWLEAPERQPLLVVTDHKSIVAYSVSAPLASSPKDEPPAK